MQLHSLLLYTLYHRKTPGPVDCCKIALYLLNDCDSSTNCIVFWGSRELCCWKFRSPVIRAIVTGKYSATFRRLVTPWSRNPRRMLDPEDEGTTIFRNVYIIFTSQHIITYQKAWIFYIAAIFLRNQTASSLFEALCYSNWFTHVLCS